VTAHAPSQADMFGTGDPLIGIRVQVDRNIDRRQPCHQNIVTLCAGPGPHAYGLRCTVCHRHRGWLPRATANSLRRAIHRIGVPDEPLILRYLETTTSPPLALATRCRSNRAPEKRSDMDMSQYSGAAFLKVADIKTNGPIRVVINDVQPGKFGRPDVSFTDGTKLSLNVTNNKVLCNAYGTESTDWANKEIELSLGTIEFEAEMQEMIVVKPISPPIEKKSVPKKKKRGDLDDAIEF
jgi:hypothetical protein